MNESRDSKSEAPSPDPADDMQSEAPAEAREPQFRFFATCARGTEGALRKELVQLRIVAPRGDKGGVWFQGSFAEGMRVCLWSRVAMRVLLRLHGYDAPSAEALYEGARQCPWQDWMTVASTFAVQSSVRDSAVRHSGYAALKVKDAIADSLRQSLGARPDVNPDDPDVGVFLHLSVDRAQLFLDMSGEPLHRRGYRVAMTEAPLKETLAAAVLSLGRAPVALPFMDPMGGSGTFVIEHAMAARRLAPGLHRNFGFQRWPSLGDPQRTAWRAVQEEARDTALPKAPAPIVYGDRFRDPFEAAQANARKAGVESDIEFRDTDVRDIHPEWPQGTVVTNPPYGERLMGYGEPGAKRPAMSGARPRREPANGREAAVRDLKMAGFYRGLGLAVRRMHGWRIVLLSGNPQLEHELRQQGARAEIEHRLWNGPIEVRMLCYDIAP